MQKHRKRLQRCANQLNTVPNADEFELAYAVPLEGALFSELEQQTRQRGVKVETLVIAVASLVRT